MTIKQILVYNTSVMSKECFICTKSTIAGRSIQHKHSVGWRYKAPHTVRQFKPNLRSIDLDIDGVVKNVTICMKCYKRLQKEAKEKNA